MGSCNKWNGERSVEVAATGALKAASKHTEEDHVHSYEFFPNAGDLFEFYAKRNTRLTCTITKSGVWFGKNRCSKHTYDGERMTNLGKAGDYKLCCRIRFCKKE